MVINKLTANTGVFSQYQEAIYKPAQINHNIMKEYHANFVVVKDEDGVLCAADMDQGIFADGKNEKELWDDIREAVECHFDVSPEEVDSKVEIRVDYK
jgi:hypothetical protein